MMERSLRSDVSVINSNGLLHFDALFKNILTDGRRLYFADLGLATSPRFELAEAELDFLQRNMSHDGCYAVTQVVNWLVTAFCGALDPAASDPAGRRVHPPRRRGQGARECSAVSGGGHHALRADRRRDKRVLLEAARLKQDHLISAR
jgi:tRNA A-37 threonylcarbamoyl transferase component Bud32